MPNKPPAGKPLSTGHVLNDRLTPREARILAGTPKTPERTPPKPPKK